MPEAKNCPDPAKNSVAYFTDVAVAHINHSELSLLSAFSCSDTIGAELHVPTSSASISMYTVIANMLFVPANFSPARKTLQSAQEQYCLSEQQKV